jgi:hypothetical protein
MFTSAEEKTKVREWCNLLAVDAYLARLFSSLTRDIVGIGCSFQLDVIFFTFNFLHLMFARTICGKIHRELLRKPHYNNWLSFENSTPLPIYEAIFCG